MNRNFCIQRTNVIQRYIWCI